MRSAKNMTHEIAVQLVDGLRAIRNRVRIKERDSSAYPWGLPLFAPVKGYLETAKSGPVTLASIEFIDVEKGETIQRGALLQPTIIDRSNEIERLLASVGLPFEDAGDFIRIKT